ncbi:glycosyltransferase [Roseomonas sp. NAR14]|uniref:Glycosyltransferase n=1 Tax=Roseomonas acroporae TaxID=2937791 RepID=A0A9X1Y6L6_9PROT|nr:glycosyltransferase [Roseomonas acroporae]MCK8785149.1 glycosyltransferase [Roseomonas acroporae]
MSPALAVALAGALAWAVLLLGRGGFWRCRENDDDAAALPAPAAWPDVAILVPARDEAETIGATVRSLLAQDYPGRFRLLVVDDRSTDGTGDLARAAAAGDPRLAVVPGTGRPPGWTGKLNALRQGLAALREGPAAPPGPATAVPETAAPAITAPAMASPAMASPAMASPAMASPAMGGPAKAVAAPQAPPAASPQDPPRYLLFTDADIAHAPDSLRRLVARAEAEGRAMVSLMAKLRCDSPAEHALIPAFVFFFAMLYPFRWSNDPGARTAAAAGGCVLLRREALEAAGGLEPIRGAMIDDCALAALIKHRGATAGSRGGRAPIWLGLTERVRSLRAYDTLDTIRRMVSRTAYAQLRYQPLLLLGMLLALSLVFLAPPLLALGGLLAGFGPASWIGLATWLAMALAYQPMLRRYGRSPLWGLALPAVALLYMGFTLDSAWADWRGRGGMWKGETRPEQP